MSRENIKERREYITSLLQSGKEVYPRDIARIWKCSPVSIVTDIAVCNGEKDPYTKGHVREQNFRAARLGLADRITETGWINVLEKYNYSCAACGNSEDIVIDHVTPLSKGGKNRDDNIQPLCRSCNSSKRNKIILPGCLPKYSKNMKRTSILLPLETIEYLKGLPDGMSITIRGLIDASRESLTNNQKQT